MWPICLTIIPVRTRDFKAGTKLIVYPLKIRKAEASNVRERRQKLLRLLQIYPLNTVFVSQTYPHSWTGQKSNIGGLSFLWKRLHRIRLGGMIQYLWLEWAE